jgi:hypothetical protein
MLLIDQWHADTLFDVLITIKRVVLQVHAQRNIATKFAEIESKLVCRAISCGWLETRNLHPEFTFWNPTVAGV